MPKHIVRLIVVVLVFAGASVVGKALFTDKSFYEFGHYRGDSVVQIAALEPVYQTPGYCSGCHAERAAQWSSQSHKSVGCEVCHGPAKGHPANGKLPVPSDTHKLCSLCHEQMAGRPASHPQIAVAAHSLGESCVMCHNAHAPRISAAAAQVVADAGTGRKRAASCAGCHGDKGISANESWPTLAGQNAPYLARILGAYKSGAQTDVAMTPIARELSDADVQHLAAFYAGLACGPATKAADGAAAAGKSLHQKACASCHGASGIATNRAWPSLAGQKPGFIVNALKAFRAGLRKDPMMAGVTRGLSDADITNLAAFYAAQDCRSQVQARSAS